MKRNSFELSVMLILSWTTLFLIASTQYLQANTQFFALESVQGKCENCDVRYGLTGIQFVTPYEGWAQGSWMSSEGQGAGTSSILRTTDGGRTWHQLKFVEQHVAEEKLPFYFINPKHGWIAWLGEDDAQAHLIRTINSGRSWEALNAPSLGAIGHLKFFDKKLGYAAEFNLESGSIFAVTRDGGKKWLRNRIPLKYVRNMFFLNPQIGWISGEAETTDSKLTACILKTTNGGESWTKTNLQPGYIHDFFAVSENKAWLIIRRDEASYLNQSSDGGATWKQCTDVSLQGRNNYLNIVRFLSENVGFVFGKDSTENKGYLVYTKDGGENWHKSSIPQVVKCAQVFQGELWCGAGLKLLKIRPICGKQRGRGVTMDK